MKKHDKLIDVEDTPLSVEDSFNGYGGGVDNIWGLGNSAADAEIRGRRAMRQNQKSLVLGQKQANELDSLKQKPSVAASVGSPDNAGTNVQAPSTQTTAGNTPPEEKEDNTMMYVGIGLGVIVVIGIIIYFVTKGK